MQNVKIWEFQSFCIFPCIWTYKASYIESAYLVTVVPLVMLPVGRLLCVWPSACWLPVLVREKGRDLTQSYDKAPIPTEQHKKQRFHNDLGQSVGVATATRLVWFNRFTSGPTFPLTASAGYQKNTHFKKMLIILRVETEDQQPTKRRGNIARRSRGMFEHQSPKTWRAQVKLSQH